MYFITTSDSITAEQQQLCCFAPVFQTQYSLSLCCALPGTGMNIHKAPRDRDGGSNRDQNYTAAAHKNIQDKFCASAANETLAIPEE